MKLGFKTEILINITAHETRLTATENNLLQEIHIERHNWLHESEEMLVQVMKDPLSSL